MRRIWVVGFLLLTGCPNIVGPFQTRSPLRVDDPNIPIDEQQRRARDRLGLPDESSLVAPPSSAAPPGAGPSSR